MRAILEDLRSGEVRTCDIPAPELRPGGILVRTAFSAISAGTERAKIEISEKSIVGKALERPDLAKQVINYARAHGVRAAYHKVQAKLDTLSAMGYSCSGEVIGVGKGVNEFSVGDRVACAGAGYANHAEINWLPVNLAVRVPDAVPLEAASLTTIGAVATHALRQAQVSFGETVAVIGAGLVGVLAIKLARAAGCRVITIDSNPVRVEKAVYLGAHLALFTSDPNLKREVETFSRYGADAVIITAASSSAEPLELAAHLVRDRGRVVVVGTIGMGASRASLYDKEVSVLMSRSYGPGRYDTNYEEGGQDYPLGYVRWTERRNMESFLDLLATGAVDVSALLDKKATIENAERTYAEIRAGGVYTAILEYGNDHQNAPVLVHPTPGNSAAGNLRIGCIGAGEFARAHIFPDLRREGVSLVSVASASGVGAESARKTFGFSRAQTAAELLGNCDINAIFIVSRNDTHAAYVVEALKADKAVFVEKPLAITREELNTIKELCTQQLQHGRQPYLAVGFNRRFAPATERVQEWFAKRSEPMMINIRVNAGYLPPSHWTQQPQQGGRIVGEFCHFVDWARHLVGSPVRSVSAFALPDGKRYSQDNLSAVLSFTDGSLANISYVANGDPGVPKEFYEVFCEGAVVRMEDFRQLELVRNRKTKRVRLSGDKGHRREIELTLETMRSGEDAPIALDQIFHVTDVTFGVRDSLDLRQAIQIKFDLDCCRHAKR